MNMHSFSGLSLSMCISVYMYMCLFVNVRVRGDPPNGIFGPCACLLAGGCGAWRLLARRRRRRRRHSSILQVDIQTKLRKIQELLENSDFGKWFAVL